VSDEQQPQQADNPSGPGWRDVEPDELLQAGDMYWLVDHWETTKNVGGKSSMYGIGYRRRIEPPQPSDSEPETMQDLRRRLAACEVLLAEAGGSGEQVNAELQQLREQVRDLTRQTQVDALELQQLREQVQTLTRELKDKSDSYQICLQNHYKAGQRSTIDRLLIWLRPVVKVVSDHPDNTSILAVSVLEFLPQIASRLIEE
jgi:ElaB/YqjD/DUF883 family membrane-anchored ribosome-binding protein